MLKKLIHNIILNADADNGDEEHGHGPLLHGLIVVLSTLVLYVLIGSFMEMMHFPVGHETGVIIIVGIVISIVTTVIDPDT